MNDTNTAAAAPVRSEIVVDLLDLLAVLLLKWKTILAFILIGAIFFGGVVLLRGGRSVRQSAVTDTDIAVARYALSPDKAEMVEHLFNQYLSYSRLQSELGAYYRPFMDNSVEVNNTVQLLSEFYIVSTIRDLDAVFINMAVTEADYQALRDILPDEEAGAPVYERILFSTAYNPAASPLVSVQDEGTGAQHQYYLNVGLNERPVGEPQYLINVELYGRSEEQCREMMAVVEAAFQRQTEELKALDPTIRLESLGEKISYDVADYVHNLTRKNLDRMAVVEDELSFLMTRISQLSSQESEYYNLLMRQHNGTITTVYPTSWKRRAILGAFLGAVLSVVVVVCRYMLDGKIKSGRELAHGLPLLSRVFVKRKRNLFGSLAAWLIRADSTDPAVKADMVATDLSILMEKTGKSDLLLLCSETDTAALSFAGLVKDRLQTKNSALQVGVINPLHSVDELEAAAKADMSVVVAQMKKSRRSTLREWRELCGRYGLPMAGAVAVEQRW